MRLKPFEVNECHAYVGCRPLLNQSTGDCQVCWAKPEAYQAIHFVGGYHEIQRGERTVSMHCGAKDENGVGCAVMDFYSSRVAIAWGLRGLDRRKLDCNTWRCLLRASERKSGGKIMVAAVMIV